MEQQLFKHPTKYVLRANEAFCLAAAVITGTRTKRVSARANTFTVRCEITIVACTHRTNVVDGPSLFCTSPGDVCWHGWANKQLPNTYMHDTRVLLVCYSCRWSIRPCVKLHAFTSFTRRWCIGGEKLCARVEVEIVGARFCGGSLFLQFFAIERADT